MNCVLQVGGGVRHQAPPGLGTAISSDGILCNADLLCAAAFAESFQHPVLLHIG